jgi:hypothetical protein
LAHPAREENLRREADAGIHDAHQKGAARQTPRCAALAPIGQGAGY